MAPTLLGTSPLFLAEVTEPDKLVHNRPQHQRLISSTNNNINNNKAIIKKSTEPTYQWDIVWRNVFGMLYLHIFSFYGLYLLIAACQWKTFIFTIFLILISGVGITGGAHRLWAHRCYKAKLPLRILLAFCQTLAFQNHIYEWVRDHRVHHKFTDTDADPHNARRGFFFSHVGWLMVRKHKDIVTKGAHVDLSDLLDDPVVRFQKKFYLILMPICCFAIPTLIPYYYWNENIFISWYVCAIFRYTTTLNGTWLVNSAAHIYGTKPYDKSIKPTENKFVAYMAFGEGWHNYHHVFPWDYKASEYGYNINITTYVIDFFARIGWAYDLKSVSRELIERRVRRTGDERKVMQLAGSKDQQPQPHDHTHHHHHTDDGTDIWGWLDKDISKEHLQYAQITNQLMNE